MDRSSIYCLYLVLFISVVQAPVPSTFLWRPRLGLYIASTSAAELTPVTYYNFREGFIVIISSYHVGMTLLALVVYLDDVYEYDHLSPLKAAFYNNAWRWFRRHMKEYPSALAINHRHYLGPHRVWKKRFDYRDKFLPNWMRYLFPFVKASSWKEDIVNYKLFHKYAEPTFSKHHGWPKKIFNDFLSLETNETIFVSSSN